jgi:hypothetical protein
MAARYSPRSEIVLPFAGHKAMEAASGARDSQDFDGSNVALQA